MLCFLMRFLVSWALFYAHSYVVRLSLLFYALSPLVAYALSLSPPPPLLLLCHSPLLALSSLPLPCSLPDSSPLPYASPSTLSLSALFFYVLSYLSPVLALSLSPTLSYSLLFVLPLSLLPSPCAIALSPTLSLCYSALLCSLSPTLSLCYSSLSLYRTLSLCYSALSLSLSYPLPVL